MPMMNGPTQAMSWLWPWTWNSAGENQVGRGGLPDAAGGDGAQLDGAKQPADCQAHHKTGFQEIVKWLGSPAQEPSRRMSTRRT